MKSVLICAMSLFCTSTFGQVLRESTVNQQPIGGQSFMYKNSICLSDPFLYCGFNRGDGVPADSNSRVAVSGDLGITWEEVGVSYNGEELSNPLFWMTDSLIIAWYLFSDTPGIHKGCIAVSKKWPVQFKTDTLSASDNLTKSMFCQFRTYCSNLVSSPDGNLFVASTVWPRIMWSSNAGERFDVAEYPFTEVNGNKYVDDVQLASSEDYLWSVWSKENMLYVFTQDYMTGAVRLECEIVTGLSSQGLFIQESDDTLLVVWSEKYLDSYSHKVARILRGENPHVRTCDYGVPTHYDRYKSNENRLSILRRGSYGDSGVFRLAVNSIPISRLGENWTVFETGSPIGEDWLSSTEVILNDSLVGFFYTPLLERKPIRFIVLPFDGSLGSPTSNQMLPSMDKTLRTPGMFSANGRTFKDKEQIRAKGIYLDLCDKAIHHTIDHGDQ